MKLWTKYLFTEIFKVFFFFLFGFFFLYSLIEYSMHMDDFFKDSQLQFQHMILYYVNQFLKRLDFLLPMALLLSTIKVLTTMTTRNEWIVFQVAGMSTRKLLRPFFIMSLFAAVLCWANFEYFLPSAFREIEDFRITHFHSSHVTKRRELIHLVPLKDNTKLVYQKFDREKNLLFDVIWIKSLDEMWRIKYLSANPANPVAEYADHLVRNNSGFFEKTESFQKLQLPDLKWHPRMERKGRIRFEERSLSDLFRLRFKSNLNPYESPKVGTALFFKAAIPLISPLLVMALAPFCLTFNRQKHLFLIYAIGLFALFALYMLLDSLTILSENGVLSPTLAIFFPLALVSSLFTWRYYLKT